jgi:hypothetical protein
LLARDGTALEAEDLVGGDTLTCDYPKFAGHFAFFCRWLAFPQSRKSRTALSTSGQPVA